MPLGYPLFWICLLCQVAIVVGCALSFRMLAVRFKSRLLMLYMPLPPGPPQTSGSSARSS